MRARTYTDTRGNTCWTQIQDTNELEALREQIGSLLSLEQELAAAKEAIRVLEAEVKILNENNEVTLCVYVCVRACARARVCGRCIAGACGLPDRVRLVSTPRKAALMPLFVSDQRLEGAASAAADNVFLQKQLQEMASKVVSKVKTLNPCTGPPRQRAVF